MKFYAIPPVKHLDLMHHGDRYFALAHLYLKHPEYREFFHMIRAFYKGAYILLDNSAAEKSLVSEDDLLQIVDELRPDEVIAPDILFDKEATMRSFRSFAMKMEMKGLLGEVGLFGCPQGRTKEEWLDCYSEMASNPHTRTIGVSKIAVPKCWNDAEKDTMIAVSRNQCVDELNERHWLSWKYKPLHLLGMGEAWEFDHYKTNRIEGIRSSDSCYSILSAIHGMEFEKGQFERIPTPHEYFDMEMTKEQQERAIRNINYLISNYASV